MKKITAILAASAALVGAGVFAAGSLSDGNPSESSVQQTAGKDRTVSYDGTVTPQVGMWPHL